MADLERELRALRASIELPAERDLWPGIERRLERPRRTPRWLRIGVVAVAAAAVAIGIAFAVPKARSAILCFLGLDGVSIVCVDELPRAAAGPGATGARVTLAEAKMLLPFRPLLPDLGPPSGIYVDRNQGLLIAVYGDGDVRLRLTELIAGTAAFQKIVSSARRVERVRVNGEPGYWIAGEHVVSGLFGEPELSGSALIWRQLPLTVRLEGRLTKAQALQVGRSVKPA